MHSDMNRRVLILVPVLASLAVVGQVRASAEVLDRITAVVDNTFIITLSDIRKERAIQTALGSKPGQDAEILDALIERRLIDVQVAQYRQIEIDDSAVEARLAAIGSPRDISRAELREAIIGELRRFEFLVQRFRQFIRVTDEEARLYYENVLVPELRSKGAAIPTAEEGIALVRPNVIAEKMNQEVDEWLRELRRRSNVEKITQ
jgi:hypothetical protein